MITLQQEPLIEWDELNTNIFAQTQEAQNWVDVNIIETQNVTVNETVISSEGVTWERPNTLTYEVEGFNLVIDIDYRDLDTCVTSGAAYNLTQI